MSEKRITYQKIRSTCKDKAVMSERYYKTVFILNGIGVTEREVQLLSYLSLHGGLLSKSIKLDFCNIYGSTLATANNIVSRLRKLGILTKEGKEVRINSLLRLDFSEGIELSVKMEVLGDG
jgi:hypothetical protein